jgi:hypothetical protein
VLESKPSTSSTERFYFSNKSGLLIQQQSTIQSPQGRSKPTLTSVSIRQVDAWHPHAIKTSVKAGDQQFEFNLKVTDLKHNQPLPDSLFAKP